MNEQILEHERIYHSNSQDIIEQFRKKIIASGMNQLVDISRQNAERIMKNIESCNFDMDVIDIVREIFTQNVDVIDLEFKRLNNQSAINYYKFFMSELRKGDFAALITSQLEYQLSRAKEDETPYMYVGQAYGEETGWRKESGGRKVYVDIRKKTRAQLINLLIVKTKIEQEFLSFQYNRAVNFLHDNGYISGEKYNMEIYGTNDEDKIRLLNLGVSLSLLNLLGNNDQLKNIFLDEYGNIVAKKQLYEFRNKQNSLVRYEMDKYIIFEDDKRV